MSDRAQQLYTDIGATPVINALGPRTLLGGSEPHPDVVEAMRLAGRYYVDMDELLERSGQQIAATLRCEAALVTPGCAAALVLGTAACLTGADPDKMAQLPDLSGLKNEVVLQKAQRYKYDRVVRMTGVRIIEVGDENGTTPDQLEAAFNDNTAAVLYPEIDAPGDLVPLEETIAIAHRHNLPVLVDSAYRVYPLDGLHRYAEMGADLFGYGAKYFGAPNSTGLLCGRKDLVDAARLHSFAGFEKHELAGFGRPFKVDRQEVFGVLAALRLWLDMDHDERHAQAQRRAENALQALGPIPHIEARAASTSLQLKFDEAALGTSAAAIEQTLRAGNPAIWLDAGPGRLHFGMLTVHDGDEAIIAARLKEALR